MYVFIREDLTHPQQAVQVCHATMSMAAKYEIPEEAPYVVLLGIKNEQKLKEVEKYLDTNQIHYGQFFEDDMDGQLTCIVTSPLPSEVKTLFKKYQLLRNNKHA